MTPSPERSGNASHEAILCPLGWRDAHEGGGLHTRFVSNFSATNGWSQRWSEGVRADEGALTVPPSLPQVDARARVYRV